MNTNTNVQNLHRKRTPKKATGLNKPLKSSRDK